MAHRVSATEGRYPQNLLVDGHRLLVEAGLVGMSGGRFFATESVQQICELDDESALPLLRRLFESIDRRNTGGFGDAEDKALIGAIGEELVVEAAREGLLRAERLDLRDQVRRVSLVDDSLGYDVHAPAIASAPRLLEVKSTVREGGSGFDFFISRNEYEVGLKHAGDWALVACAISPGRVVEGSAVVGWCRAAALRPYLPEDANGRWTEAQVWLPRSVLNDGIPPAV